MANYRILANMEWRIYIDVDVSVGRAGELELYPSFVRDIISGPRHVSRIFAPGKWERIELVEEEK